MVWGPVIAPLPPWFPLIPTSQSIPGIRNPFILSIPCKPHSTPRFQTPFPVDTSPQLPALSFSPRDPSTRAFQPLPSSATWLSTAHLAAASCVARGAEAVGALGAILAGCPVPTGAGTGRTQGTVGGSPGNQRGGRLGRDGEMRNQKGKQSERICDMEFEAAWSPRGDGEEGWEG